MVSFLPLEADTLREILAGGVLEDYRREFEAEGLQLEVDDAVLDFLVQRAIKRELGARGLRAALVPYLEEAAYENFGSARDRVVRLTIEDDAVEVTVSS